MSAYSILDEAAEHLEYALACINDAQIAGVSPETRQALESLICKLDSLYSELLVSASLETS